MSLLTEVLDRVQSGETSSFDGACELGRGLMRGHRASFQQGYSWQAAAQSAARIFEGGEWELSLDERNMLDCHLEGYAYGIAEDSSPYLPAPINPSRNFRSPR